MQEGTAESLWMSFWRKVGKSEWFPGVGRSIGFVLQDPSVAFVCTFPALGFDGLVACYLQSQELVSPSCSVDEVNWSCQFNFHRLLGSAVFAAGS